LFEEPVLNNETEQNDAHDSIWRQEKAIERLGGEKALLQRLAKLFLRDTPGLLESAKLGIESKDYDAAFVPLHSIKGTSSSFCADDFERSCECTLEALSKREWQRARDSNNELTKHYKDFKATLEAFILDA
tara:strand:+ start:6632 stop:7024 length:393 start_codon:yes stop_codon:yes gene_type:complete